MAYKLIWQPFKKGWAIYSTVTCSFHKEGVKRPEEVADYIIGDHEYYFTETEHPTLGKIKVEARCQHTSREQIEDNYDKWIKDAEDSCVDVLTPTGWEKECTPKEQVKENLQRVKQDTLERWDRCEICPDPKAKESLQQHWIEEAKRVRDEGILTLGVTKCEITPRGFEVKGKEILGPERW